VDECRHVVTDLPADVSRLCDECLSELIRLGYVAEVDARFLWEARRELASVPAMGPIVWLPHEGHIDLTLTGAMLIRDCLRTVFHWIPESMCCGCSVRPGVLYAVATSREFLLECVERPGSEHPSAKGREPIPIGAWRDRWWRLFDKGWLLEFPTDLPEVQ
jgi:hypothetical protein